jgi:hypothetical protein
MTMYYPVNSRNHQDKPIDITKYEAVVASQASSKVSGRYKFIPTTRALSVLADYGWFPVAASQANTRVEENQGFQKHAIRLASDKFNRELSVGSTIPQILLTNSHAGSAAFNISMALFEKVCLNGLCVARGASFEMRVLHSGYADLDMENAVKTIAQQFPATLTQVEQFKQIPLTQTERLAFARSAIELRFDGDKYSVSPDEVLRSHRREEQLPTLWNTYNVVQEKVIRGGVNQRRIDNSRIRSREIKNIGENIKLNRALWTLTEKMAELKGFSIN